MDKYACRTGSALERFGATMALGVSYDEPTFDDGTAELAVSYSIDAPEALPSGTTHCEGGEPAPAWIWRGR